MKNAKISEVLKNYRKLNKLSVRDVSGILKEKSLNVAEKTIYGWESGQTQPNADTLLMLCEIYNIENISIVDVAVKAKDAYNVNPLKQYVIGVGSGFLIGSLIITVMFYFDDSIKKPEDIEEKVGLSVLSTVPKYKGKKKRK